MKITQKLGQTLSLLIFALVVTISHATNAGALPVTGFNPGNIIDDPTFTNSGTMNANQIQAFLSSKVPSCDTNGAQQSEMNNAGVPDYNGNGSIQRWEWGKYKYNQTKFPCLKDYVENSRSAAQIIYNAAQQYAINPQVLIALLQKEQGLVTDTWPLNKQYRTATGYGCPDTAPCDSQYYGFTNQIAKAANMFHQIMIDSPTWYTPYNLGNNFILWNPSTSCGGSTVNIENRATQALYNYTPYRPNQAALDAGYGTGNACSSYGNRNFFLYFRDWFGALTQQGTLFRSFNNAQVYILSGDKKYPVNSQSTLDTFSKLGPIGYASDGYINELTTGPVATSLIKQEGTSTLYFLNASIKLPFTSCGMAAHYDRPCGSEISLTPSQMNKFANGPNMTQLYETTTGYKYYIQSGNRREVFDSASQQAASITGSYNRLLENGVSHLAEGEPVIRDNVVATNRTNGKHYLYQNDKLFYLPADIIKMKAFSDLPRQKLNQGGLNALTQGNPIGGFVQNSGGVKYILDSKGKVALSNPGAWADTFVQLEDSFVASVPNSTQPVNNYFVKGSGGTIYYAHGGKKYSITNWGDFVKLHTDKSDTLSTIADESMATLQTGPNIYAPGSLVKSNNSATVYVVNGLFHKIALGSFAVSSDIGLQGTRTVTAADLSAMTTDSGIINNIVACGGKSYLANLGRLYEIDASARTAYGYTQPAGSSWDSLGCSNLQLSADKLSKYSFIKSDNSKTIYYIQSGQKRPVSSMAQFESLGGSSSTLLRVSDNVLQTISDGPVI